MDETRKLGLRSLLVVLAVGAAATTVWAATAFAAGGSSPASEPAAGSDPIAAYVQAQEDSETPSGDDCPEANADSTPGGSGGEFGSGGSDATDF